MLEPYQGRAYDPAIGSGGFFACQQARQIRFAKGARPFAQRGVQSQDKPARGARRFGFAQRARRVRMPGRHLKQSNPTTWRLVAELDAQFVESARLKTTIGQNLKGLGYGG